MTASVADLRRLAVAAARVAGEILVQGQRDVAEVGTKTSATDVVTQMDVASERALVDLILAERPADAILGEESGQRPGSSGLRWVLDPLDGTVNYLYGLPIWGVSVAVADDSGPVAGAVAIPALGELFHAGRGAGASLESWAHPQEMQAPRVSVASHLSAALVGTGFGYRPDRRRGQADVLRHVVPRVRDIRRAGAAAVDLVWVASGRLDGYFERGLQPWDHAAGELIVTESGGRVSGRDIDGPVDDRLCVASGPGIHSELHSLVTSLGAHRTA